MYKILLLQAVPRLARVDRESRLIREYVADKAKDRFLLEVRQSIRPQDIQDALREFEPHLVHFCGHGTESGCLIVEDEFGKENHIEPEALARAFELYGQHIECVIINTCYSAKTASLVSKFVPCVIGMKTNVHDKSAIAFSRGFYSVLCSSKLETLPSSQLYESVFDAGSLAVDMVKFSDSGSPTIYRRTSCSQLSQLKQSQKTTTSRRWHKALLYSLFCISFAGISSQVVHPVSEQKASSRIETVYKLPEELSKELSEEIKQLDLSQLSILLEEKEWQAADQKTGELILIAAGRYRDGFLSGKSIEELSCTHLEAIDNLWDIHTDGRFSFRKQAEIWNSLSRNLQSFDYDVYKEFGKTVGWYVPEDDLWLSPSDASFSLTAPDGHFPSGGRGGIWSFGERGTELLKRCDYALSQQ